MNILNALHTLLQGHPQQVQQAHPAQAATEIGHRLPTNAQPRAYMQAAPLQPMPYRLPMNPDGSGGGFAARPASSLHHLIHGGSMQGFPGMETPIQQAPHIQATDMGQYGEGSAIQGPQNAGFTLGQSAANPQFSTPRFGRGNIRF